MEPVIEQALQTGTWLISQAGLIIHGLVGLLAQAPTPVVVAVVAMLLITPAISSLVMLAKFSFKLSRLAMRLAWFSMKLSWKLFWGPRFLIGGILGILILLLYVPFAIIYCLVRGIAALADCCFGKSICTERFISSNHAPNKFTSKPVGFLSRGITDSSKIEFYKSLPEWNSSTKWFFGTKSVHKIFRPEEFKSIKPGHCYEALRIKGKLTLGQLIQDYSEDNPSRKEPASANPFDYEAAKTSAHISPPKIETDFKVVYLARDADKVHAGFIREYANQPVWKPHCSWFISNDGAIGPDHALSKFPDIIPGQCWKAYKFPDKKLQLIDIVEDHHEAETLGYLSRDHDGNLYWCDKRPSWRAEIAIYSFAEGCRAVPNEVIHVEPGTCWKAKRLNGVPDKFELLELLEEHPIVWVARDNSKALNFYRTKPKWLPKEGYYTNQVDYIGTGCEIPEVLVGQCYEAEKTGKEFKLLKLVEEHPVEPETYFLTRNCKDQISAWEEPPVWNGKKAFDPNSARTYLATKYLNNKETDIRSYRKEFVNLLTEGANIGRGECWRISDTGELLERVQQNLVPATYLVRMDDSSKDFYYGGVLGNPPVKCNGDNWHDSNMPQWTEIAKEKLPEDTQNIGYECWLVTDKFELIKKVA